MKSCVYIIYIIPVLLSLIFITSDIFIITSYVREGRGKEKTRGRDGGGGRNELLVIVSECFFGRVRACAVGLGILSEGVRERRWLCRHDNELAIGGGVHYYTSTVICS